MLVCNETKFSYNRHKWQWRLGPHVVNEDVNYKRLGVNCNKYLSIDINLKEAAKTIKEGTF